MSIQPCHEPRCTGHAGAIELLIEPRAKDLGDFSVRRLLPSSARQRVGPFIFFDHMGPARFAPGQGVAVRPHPHIGLATLTYLFDGVILHRDSLGFTQPITPGAANWMTAGRGIVHSERTPEEQRASGSTLHGLQLWLALPRELEETQPGFAHHPAGTLPRIERPGASLRLVAGAAYGERSPVETASETLYLAGRLAAGAELALPDAAEERAVYVAQGELALGGERLAEGAMAVLRGGAAARVSARRDSLLALVGGAPLAGERHLWWNFVSSSRERIERAKADWREGRFGAVPGDPARIPLPED
jgi:redox-sensitive bicupin YhaK (pirin superfamily)